MALFGQVAACARPPEGIERDETTGGAFLIAEDQADGSLALVGKMRDVKRPGRLVRQVVRRTAFPGPARFPIAAIERLEYERGSLPVGRMFGNQDLGPLVAIEVGNGELRKRPEAVFVVQSMRPEQPAITERDGPELVVGPHGSRRPTQQQDRVEGPVVVEVAEAGRRLLSGVLLIGMLTQGKVPEEPVRRVPKRGPAWASERCRPSSALFAMARMGSRAAPGGPANPSIRQRRPRPSTSTSNRKPRSPGARAPPTRDVGRYGRKGTWRGSVAGRLISGGVCDPFIWTMTSGVPSPSRSPFGSGDAERL